MKKRTFTIINLDTDEPLDKIEVVEPENDDLGEQFSHNIRVACRILGFKFRFYTSSKETDFNAYVIPL